jgi:circadian clock protein KaiC
MTSNKFDSVPKLETGIPGFDHVASGGLPKGRTCLLSGTAGSSKTVFAVQFLVEGIRRSEGGSVFVTFEESPADIRRNMLGFGWDIERFEEEKKWAFVDASPQPDMEVTESGSYDLGGLLARIEHAIRKTGAGRVSIDSLGAVFGQFLSADTVRRELHRVAMALKSMGVTAVMTAERTEEYGSLARYGVEEFVADNVIILRNVLEEEKRRRTVEILKFRGTNHHKGEFPFTIIPGEGIVVIPLSEIKLQQKSSNVRLSSGNRKLDEMCGGGFFRDSILLVSGATGTGKTLLVTEFINGGRLEGEKSLLFAFEESREQMFRNATGWGMDFEKMEHDGKLKVVSEYPEVMGLEDHLIKMKKEIERFKPTRVAVDSLSALDRVSTAKGFREFVIALTSFIKHQEIVGLFSSTTPSLLGGTSITEAHISSITDSIILLRYVEMFGEMRRGITVLKMRGSMHDKEIREYTIDGKGMHIGAQFRNVAGILAGNPTQVTQQDIERLGGLFSERD